MEKVSTVIELKRWNAAIKVVEGERDRVWKGAREAR